MPARCSTRCGGFAGNGMLKDAIELFDGMPTWNGATACALVLGFVKNGMFRAAEDFLTADKRVRSLDGIVAAFNTLIAGYGQAGRPADARRMFDAVASLGLERNVVSWNSVIMSYVKAGEISSARILFDQMPERDAMSWNTMITAYVQSSLMEEAERLFGAMDEPDTVSWNLLICGFAQIGDVKHAREFFDKMPNKGIYSWNTMISGYEQNKDYTGAVELFARIIAIGEKPDRHTLSSALGACAGLVMLQLGRQMHQITAKMIIPDIPIYNALVTLYARCGELEDAKAVFDRMGSSRSLISWNAMIGGFAHHGFAVEALQLFEEMQTSVTPTPITFLSLLNACSHAGLVPEGRRVFDTMVQKFGMAARIEHYASLVDLVGRHGQLEDALAVIRSMSTAPDHSVWCAFLGACRLHKNAGLARVAAKALSDLEPASSAPYVLLHNLHVDEGQWELAGEVRVEMDRHGVIKPTGWSSVELHGDVHVFVAGDTSHPLSSQIWSLVESCDRSLREQHIYEIT